MEVFHLILQKKCRRLLGLNLDSNATGAKVAWNQVALPKQDDGLGLKKLEEWNTTTCIARNMWCLLLKSGSLLVAWCYAFLLRGRSVWSIDIHADSTWNSRKILKI